MVRSDSKIALATLSVATGALDVSAFLRLGGVFASIMTSNLVFVSLAAVNADASLGRHCAAALLSYIAGVAVGSIFAGPRGPASQLGSGRVSLPLSVEALVLAGYSVWWVAEGARPEGWQQLALLGAVAFAMGLQSAAARHLGDPQAGTTYLTGTLTGMISSASWRQRPDGGAAVAIAGILAGAATGAGLLRTIPEEAPIPAVAGVAITAGLSWYERVTSRNPRAADPATTRGDDAT
jgi:uncharacterized membrane protein YoaK (UPF0700 family)